MTGTRCAIDRETVGTPPTVLLHLSGRFDRAGRPELQRALRAVVNRVRPVGIVLDVRLVDFICAECVDLLLVAYTKALVRGHGYEIVNARGHVRRALATAGLCPPGADEDLYAPAGPDALEAAPVLSDTGGSLVEWDHHGR